MHRIDGPGHDNNRWVAEDPTTNRPPTEFTAEFNNAIQEEICSFIEWAGLALNKGDNTQLRQAILAKFGAIYSISALPTSNKGPIIVAEVGEVWIWSTSAYFTGYRSPLCGRPVDGHTFAPLPSEIDATGGVLSKAAYAGLWGYAQENSLAITQANWTANIGGHYFVDVDANTFRIPDLRNMFRRYTGTDADTANARALGSRQLDAIQNITGTWSNVILRDTTNASGAFAAGPGNGSGATGTSGSGNGFTFDASRVVRTSSETRGRNVAYVPRLHV
ncbi:phage tail protein [Herbaspirillum huttiense]|uniref:phage tail protein n=1 Tax=Herbaspirillum huttiense TaxID=863372 RepID=UPI0039B04C99